MTRGGGNPVPNAAAEYPLLAKEDFIGLDASVVHLGAGLESPMLKSHEGIFTRFARDKSAGADGRQRLLDEYVVTRQLTADLLGVDESWVGFSYNVAHFMNQVANALAADSGDNVLVIENEFPSVIYPWLQQSRRGLEVVVIPGAHSAEDEEALVASHLTSRTRAIVISHSSYLSGIRRDLARYRALADSVGAALVVDASHTLGSIAVDGGYADFLVSACYKWLFGVHGVAVSLWNRERQPDWKPSDVGWASVVMQDPAMRGREPYSVVADGRIFELGNPSLLGIHILGNALRVIGGVGVTEIERHNLALSGLALSLLGDLPVKLLTPPGDAERAGNVAFAVEDETAWQEDLRRAGVIAAVGQRRLRLSTHAFNSIADVRSGVQAVASAYERGLR